MTVRTFPDASPDERVAMRYQLGPILGTGGMSTVYRGYDPLLDRSVAVKVLNSAWADTPTARRRFLREARMQSAVQHRGVPEVHDFGVDPSFLAMEALDGDSVWKLLDANGPFEWRRAANIAADLCDVLAACHRAGVVHRDVKPSNVFVCADDSVRLIDFGIAKRYEPLQEETTSTVLGTPAYISPEQLRGGGASPASDLYGLGCLLFSMLTGGPPFSPGGDKDLTERHVSEEPVAPSVRTPGIPAVMDALVLQLLAKDPARRPTSATDVRARLLAIASMPHEDFATRPMPLERTERIEPEEFAAAAPQKGRTGAVSLTLGLLAAGLLVAAAAFAGTPGQHSSAAKPAKPVVANPSLTPTHSPSPTIVATKGSVPALPFPVPQQSANAAVSQFVGFVGAAEAARLLSQEAMNQLDGSAQQLLAALGRPHGHRVGDALGALGDQVGRTVASMPAGDPAAAPLTRAFYFIQLALTSGREDN